MAALLAQTTFLPALLLVVGRAAFWLRTPEHGAGWAESWVWASIAARVARYPVRTVIVVVVLLGVACAGLASLRTDDSLLDNMKSGTDSAIGQNLIDAHYPAGDFKVHDLENIGDAELIFTTVEFLDSENPPLDLPQDVRARAGSPATSR